MKTGMSRANEPIGKPPEYPYFSGVETRSISYIGIPRILLTDDKFKKVSAEAMLLYGIMVDRTKLSARNGWVDKEGRVYIYCPRKTVMKMLRCGDTKAGALLAELDDRRGAGLITRVRQGLGKPDRIYVRNCALPQMDECPAEEDEEQGDLSDCIEVGEDSEDEWNTEKDNACGDICKAEVPDEEQSPEGNVEPAPADGTFGKDDGAGVVLVHPDSLDLTDDEVAENNSGTNTDVYPGEDNFVNRDPEVFSSTFNTSENNVSRVLDSDSPERFKTLPNYTEKNKKEWNNIDPILSESGRKAFVEKGPTSLSSKSAVKDRWDPMEKYRACRTYFNETCHLESLCRENPAHAQLIREMIDLLVETCCSGKEKVRIGGEEKPAEVVRARFMELDSGHIQYVLNCFTEGHAKIRNIRQYLLTALYNAPMTISSYYTAMANYDRYGDESRRDLQKGKGGACAVVKRGRGYNSGFENASSYTAEDFDMDSYIREENSEWENDDRTSCDEAVSGEVKAGEVNEGGRNEK